MDRLKSFKLDFYSRYIHVFTCNERDQHLARNIRLLKWFKTVMKFVESFASFWLRFCEFRSPSIMKAHEFWGKFWCQIRIQWEKYHEKSIVKPQRQNLVDLCYGSTSLRILMVVNVNKYSLSPFFGIKSIPKIWLVLPKFIEVLFKSFKCSENSETMFIPGFLRIMIFLSNLPMNTDNCVLVYKIFEHAYNIKHNASQCSGC